MIGIGGKLLLIVIQPEQWEFWNFFNGNYWSLSWQLLFWNSMMEWNWKDIFNKDAHDENHETEKP